jgi:hypothetical protein
MLISFLVFNSFVRRPTTFLLRRLQKQAKNKITDEEILRLSEYNIIFPSKRNRALKVPVAIAVIIIVNIMTCLTASVV